MRLPAQTLQLSPQHPAIEDNPSIPLLGAYRRASAAILDGQFSESFGERRYGHST